jgi:hypothetical protein
MTIVTLHDLAAHIEALLGPEGTPELARRIAGWLWGWAPIATPITPEWVATFDLAELAIKL